MRYRLLAALVLAVIALWSAAWFYLAGRAQDRFIAWLASVDAAGLNTRHGALGVSGYPYRLVLAIDGLSINQPGGWAWQSGPLRVVSQPWNADHLVLLFDSPQTVTPAPGAPSVRLDARRARASLVNNGREERLVLDLEDLTLQADGGAPLAAGRLQIFVRHAFDGAPAQETPAETVPEGAGPHLADVAIKAQAVHVPAAKPTKLGEVIDSFGAQAAVYGQLPTLDGAGLSRWSKQGGGMEVSDFRLKWGPLTISGSGPFTLDQHGRPFAAFMAVISGHEAMIDALATTGMIDQPRANIARMMLGTLAKEGGNKPLEVGVNMAEGFLFVGPVPLADLKPLIP